MGPLLLLAAVLPIALWNVNGEKVSYFHLWQSGTGAAISTLAVLITTGAWGMAARIPNSRWAFVFAPLLPYVVLGVAGRDLAPDADLVLTSASALVVAVGLYLVLFHTKSVREYLG